MLVIEIPKKDKKTTICMYPCMYLSENNINCIVRLLVNVLCDTDVDECLLGLDFCDSDAECHNIAGSYECYCPAGKCLFLDASCMNSSTQGRKTQELLPLTSCIGGSTFCSSYKTGQDAVDRQCPVSRLVDRLVIYVKRVKER